MHPAAVDDRASAWLDANDVSVVLTERFPFTAHTAPCARSEQVGVLFLVLDDLIDSFRPMISRRSWVSWARLSGRRTGAQEHVARHRQHVTRMRENGREIREEAKDALRQYSEVVAGRQAQGLGLTAVCAAAPTLVVQFGGPESLDGSTVALAHGLWFGMWGVAASRMAGVFMAATSTVGMRFGAMPRWLSRLGFVLGALLGLTGAFAGPLDFLFPAWLVTVSVTLLVTSRGRRRAPAASISHESAPDSGM